MKKLLHFADGAWVNQPRRIYKWYREIFKHMPKNRKMKIYGTRGSWVWLVILYILLVF